MNKKSILGLLIISVLFFSGCTQQQTKYTKLEGNVNVGSTDFGGVPECVSEEKFENNIPTNEKCCWADVFGYIRNVGTDTAKDVTLNCEIVNMGKIAYTQSKNVGNIGIGSNIRFDMRIENIECFPKYNIPQSPKANCEVTCSNCEGILKIEGGY